MPTVSAHNDGSSRFTVTHLESEQIVLTDPPTGHGGDGTSFAPTDLLDAALLACTGATIQLKAKSLGFDCNGLKLSSSHTMADSPRRIASFDIEIDMPFAADERQKRSIIAAAKGCPVRNTLSANTVIKMTVRWPDGQTDVVEK
jgi:putative redox protein